jgi:hypothetical protein
MGRQQQHLLKLALKLGVKAQTYSPGGGLGPVLHLWRRQSAFGFHKGWGISWLVKLPTISVSTNLLLVIRCDNIDKCRVPQCPLRNAREPRRTSSRVEVSPKSVYPGSEVWERSGTKGVRCCMQQNDEHTISNRGSEGSDRQRIRTSLQVPNSDTAVASYKHDTRISEQTFYTTRSTVLHASVGNEGEFL